MDPRVTRAIEIVERDLHQPIKLQRLARGVGLSVSRFHQLFHVNTGFSPGYYFRILRLNRARQLLERSQISIKEISYIAGYFDRSHFEREFKKIFGVTPHACRTAALPSLLREPKRDH